MNKLEMLIQSAEARYDSYSNVFCYNFSCSLLNIYKGRCDLLVTNEQTNIKEELLIKRDRAIMEGNIKVSNTFFESLPTQLANKSEKPAKIEIIINDNLNVKPDGVLLIEKEISCKINDFQFFIPII
tara:strand:+ start:281 stop:661 length:381 start_codon:yes stop_codon:yes gene_type:complete